MKRLALILLCSSLLAPIRAQPWNMTFLVDSINANDATAGPSSTVSCALIASQDWKKVGGHIYIILPTLTPPFKVGQKYAVTMTP